MELSGLTLDSLKTTLESNTAASALAALNGRQDSRLDIIVSAPCAGRLALRELRLAYSPPPAKQDSPC